MTHSAPQSDLGTHEVCNQPDSRGDCDLWESDPVLRSIAPLMGAQNDPIRSYAKTLGKAKLRVAARDANRHMPELDLFDRGGRRLDEVRGIAAR